MKTIDQSGGQWSGAINVHCSMYFFTMWKHHSNTIKVFHVHANKDTNWTTFMEQCNNFTVNNNFRLSLLLQDSEQQLQTDNSEIPLTHLYSQIYRFLSTCNIFDIANDATGTQSYFSDSFNDAIVHSGPLCCVAAK